MKKVFFAVCLAVLFAASACFAAGSCSQKAGVSGTITTITLTCTGDASNGGVPATALTNTYTFPYIGKHLLAVKAYPTPSGTAPDAADITVKDVSGLDMLGALGTNLIHATDTIARLPYNATVGLYWYPAIDSVLTVAVANQATVSANFTIELQFE